MAYVTKMMRQHMAADAAERRHPEWATQRIARHRAYEQALADTKAKFPVLTAENFEEANNFRMMRVRELTNEIRP